MKLNRTNYYGFDHKKVNKKISGGLSYIGDMCMKSSKNAVAVYKVDTPDRDKGHKDYVFLTHEYIGGMTQEQAEENAIHDAVYCTDCDTILYSVNRHDYNTCGCPNDTMIDGGRDYIHSGGKDLTKVVHGQYNVLNGDFIKDEIK